MTHVLAKTHCCTFFKKYLVYLFIFKLRVKYKSQSMVPSLNHRHGKNKILVLSLWIPEMSFASLCHIYTVVFIYCCRKISLKYLTASYNPHFTLKQTHWRSCGKNKTKQIPTNPKPWKVRPWTAQRTPVTWWSLCFWRQSSCFNIPETTFLILACLLRKSNSQRAFSSKQYI